MKNNPQPKITEESDSLDGVSVPGLKIILASKRSVWIRFIWALAIMFSIGLFCIQIAERIDFFINHSIGMKIDESNEIVPELPKITLCNKHTTLFNKMGYNEKNFRHISLPNVPQWMCQLINETSLEDCFRKLKIPTDDIKFLGKNANNKWIPITYSYKRWNGQIGSCVTLEPEIAETQPFSKLRLTVSDSWFSPMQRKNGTDYLLYIHEENIPYTPEWIIKHSILRTNEPLTAIIQSSQFIYMNTTQKICVSKEQHEHCRKRCLEEASNLTICPLPYMKLKTAKTEADCSNAAVCVSAVAQAHDIYQSFNAPECGCGLKCNSFIFNVQMTRSLPNVYDNIQLPTASLELHFNSFNLNQEYVAYNFVSLLSDIGGSLGLTLGLSILGLLETVTSISGWLRKIKIHKAKQKLLSKSLPQCTNQAVGDRSNSNPKWLRGRHLCIFTRCLRDTTKAKILSREDDNLPDVSIPGVPIFYAKTTFWRKFLWFIIIIVSITLSLMQVQRHIDYLNNNSTAIRISVNPNEGVKPPLIVTICPIIKPSEWKYSRYIDYLMNKYKQQGHNQTIEHLCDFLDTKTKEFNLQSTWLYYNADSPSHLSRKLQGRYSFHKYWGNCMALDIGVKFKENKFFYDFFLELNHGNWHYPGHPERFVLVLTDNGQFTDFEIIQHGQIIQLNSENTLTVEITKFSYVNQSSKPCYGLGKINEKHIQCLQRTLKDGATCHFPGLGIPGYHECNETLACKSFYDQFRNKMRSFNWDKCNINDKRCEGTVFKYSRYSTPLDPQLRKTRLRFHFQDLAIKYIEEYVTYTFISLLCDIGAIFGVIMGACILTLLQLLELAIFACKSLTKNESKKAARQMIVVKRHITAR